MKTPPTRPTLSAEEEEHEELRRLRASGATQAETAAALGVSRDVIAKDESEALGTVHKASDAPIEELIAGRETKSGRRTSVTDVTDKSETRGDVPGGAQTLNAVEAFLRRFVAYPSESAVVAHVAWIAHAWVMESWENTPRLAFLSPEPGSGKSRALEVTELLVPRPIHAVNFSVAYLIRKVCDEAGAPTILFDEVDTVFGPKAKDNEDVRGMLNAGHRRGATSGRCETVGKRIETKEFPAYCAVALAGLNDLPDTISSRSIIVRMRRRAPGEIVEPFRSRIHEPQGHLIAERLSQWITQHVDSLREAWPQMPPEIHDREADCWEPLFAVADIAGGDWPGRVRAAAVAIVAERKANASETLGVRLLSDLRRVFDNGGRSHLTTEEILDQLNAFDESPWGDLRGKPLDARGLSRRLRNYGVHPKTVRVGEVTRKGYDRSDLADVWLRYLPPLSPIYPSQPSQASQPPPVSSDLSVTTVTSDLFSLNVPDVTDVTDARERTPDTACRTCGVPLSRDRAAYGKTTCVGCEASDLSDLSGGRHD